MKILIRIIPLFLITLFQAGCLFFAKPLPADLANIELAVSSSSHVEILTPKIRVIDGTPILKGNVRRAFRSESTKDTSLEVTFYGRADEILASRFVHFSPLQLPARSTHPFNEGHYEVPLSDLPPGARRIEVKAVISPGPT